MVTFASANLREVLKYQADNFWRNILGLTVGILLNTVQALGGVHGALYTSRRIDVSFNFYSAEKIYMLPSRTCVVSQEDSQETFYLGSRDDRRRKITRESIKQAVSGGKYSYYAIGGYRRVGIQRLHAPIYSYVVIPSPGSGRGGGLNDTGITRCLGAEARRTYFQVVIPWPLGDELSMPRTSLKLLLIAAC